MRQKTEQQIIEYIEFLRDMGYVISLGGLNSTLLERSFPALSACEHHLCDLCIFMKSNQETKDKCIRNKKLLIASAKREILYDCCWAGIEEYVFPVVRSDQLICYIHISGYRGTLKHAARRASVAEKKRGKKVSELYSRLSTDIPTKESLLRLISPFYHMFETLTRESLAERPEDNHLMTLYLKTLQYIHDHYTEDIKTNTIAQAVNYSPALLRTIFLKLNGLSIAEYVNYIRLGHASELLRFTTLPITDIAYQCGFCDGNYFSTVFKKFFKMPPSAYRKSFER